MLYQRAFNNDDYRPIQISSDTILEDYVNYFGNWTILEKNLSKSHFTSKKDLISALLRSSLAANQELAGQLQNSDWNIEAIKRRQKLFTPNSTLIW